MKLINHTNPRIIIADEGYHFRAKNDEYVPSYIDEETGELVPEHEVYWMTMCFPGVQIQTIEDVEELYVEERIGES